MRPHAAARAHRSDSAAPSARSLQEVDAASVQEDWVDFLARRQYAAVVQLRPGMAAELERYRAGVLAGEQGLAKPHSMCVATFFKTTVFDLGSCPAVCALAGPSTLGRCRVDHAAVANAAHNVPAPRVSGGAASIGWPVEGVPISLRARPGACFDRQRPSRRRAMEMQRAVSPAHVRPAVPA